MSTLSTANIESKAANTPPVIKDLNGTECGQFCRAWVNFNGTGTVAIRDSFNVSSITDNGTGDYTITFATAMADANYAMVGTGSLDARTETIVVTGYTEATRLAGSIRVNTRYDNSIATNGINVDVSTVAIAIFGG